MAKSSQVLPYRILYRIHEHEILLRRRVDCNAQQFAVHLDGFLLLA